VRYMVFLCPRCHIRMDVNGSRKISDTVTEVYVSCPNCSALMIKYVKKR